jgi:Putative porin
MKSSSKWLVVPLLATALFAQTAATPKARKAPAKPAVPAVTAADVQALKDALAAQQQQIQQLQQALTQRDQAVQAAQQQAQQAQSTAADAQQKAAAVEASAGAAKESLTKYDSDLTDVKTTIQNQLLTAQDEQKRVSALESAFGRFRLVGDVRIRGESFFQQGVADRNRARIRVRFGFDGKLNEDFFGGIALATGSFGDPTTTNETMTNNFDRKTIGLDRGYITYNPVAHKWLSITGGKFAYNWQRTSVTFDPDLNPEGFTAKISYDLHHTPVIQNVYVEGINLLYNEVSGTGGLFHGHDSFAVGGQAGAKLGYKIWTVTPSFTILNWRLPDAILNSSAFAVAANNAGINGNPTTTPTVSNVGPIPVPGEGPGCSNNSVKTVPGAPAVPINVPSSNGCVFAPNGMTNATWVDLTNPTAPKWHFLSQFLYADFILNNTFKTPAARFPINLILEYEDNLNAAAHPFTTSSRSGCVSNGGTPPVITCTTSQPAVNTSLSSQSHAYLVDFSVGQQKNKGDIQVGYAWLRQEQDSVIASFNESDQRAPTNILQHRIYALWKIRANTVAGFTWWHGRTLNSNLLNSSLATGVAAGQVEPYLTRLQFDWIYTF